MADAAILDLAHQIGSLTAKVDDLVEGRKVLVAKVDHIHSCIETMKNQTVTNEVKTKSYRAGLIAGLLAAAGTAGASAREGLEFIARLFQGGGQ